MTETIIWPRKTRELHNHHFDSTIWNHLQFRDDDIIIASEGDTLMGRFRVIRLTNTSADVEEVSTGRRATLNLEQSPTG